MVAAVVSVSSGSGSHAGNERVCGRNIAADGSSVPYGFAKCGQHDEEEDDDDGTAPSFAIKGVP